MAAPGLIAMLLLQVLPAPASQRWEEFAVEGDLVVSMAPASVRRDGDLARILIRAAQGPRAAPSDVSILRIVINCENGRFGIEAGDRYAADGTLVASRSVRFEEVHMEMRPTIAGGPTLQVRACGSQPAVH
jgi:hypothetical protein